MGRRDEIARERARRAAAIAVECGMTETPIPSAREMAEAAEAQGVPLATSGAPLLDFHRFRARRLRAHITTLLEELALAISERDLQAVWDVLDEATAIRCLPPAVREEALVIARLSRTSHRAPMRLYQFHEQLRQLGDEPLEWGDPDQLDLGLSPGAGAARWRNAEPAHARSDEA